jgi:enoyl-CoA hydratase/carnithine racemase
MNPITIEKHPGFQTITMNWTVNNPGFRSETFEAVSTALRAADLNAEISSTVFFGVPRCFCLGSDVNVFVEDTDLDDLSETILRFFRSLINSKTTLIAAVDGTAIGLGMTMLCHFDAVFATPSSTFKAPFVNWGLSPEAGASLLLPEAIGYQKAFNLFCLGGELSADEAEQYGLITRVVNHDVVRDTAMNAAEHLAKISGRSLRATRDLLRSQRGRIMQRARTETDIFKELLGEKSTQRRLKIMSRATRMALAS